MARDLLNRASLYIGHADVHVRRQIAQLRSGGGRCWGIVSGPVDGSESWAIAISESGESCRYLSLRVGGLQVPTIAPGSQRRQMCVSWSWSLAALGLLISHSQFTAWPS